jgi:DNA-binding winged helix-turn-helix (wHTH) protein/tetratricopeptide (TPR) repeat protein
MESLTFRFGTWQVDPSDNSISDGQEKRQMEPRAMDVLVALCKQANTIISADQLLEQCWGSSLYGDNPVHKVITQLRKILGDKSSAPEYIETIRKRGYRTIAPVQYDYSESSQVGTWIKESPFRGLQAFDEKHAAIFFGRSDAIYHLTQIISNHTVTNDSVELFMVLGPSGSGKSSVVRAGLIPNMMQNSRVLQIASHSCFDLAEQGEHSLFTTLAGMLLDLEIADQGLFPKMSANTLGRQLQERLDDVIATLQASLLTFTPPLGRSITYRHALFLDRFEAVFDTRQIDAQEKDQFLMVLDRLARSHTVMILLACRNDFYPHIAASPILMEAKARGTHYDLNPPTHAEIAQMIRLPALAARLSFGIDEQSKVRLDDVLCEGTTGNPDALPLLQYTLHELYRLRSQDGELTFAAFNQLGGIEGAIGQRAEQVINALAEEQKQALPQVLSLVTTISANENIVTSRRAAWAQLSNENERAVVNALVESRLFVSELVDGAPGFGVAHEALLRRWPRVVEWINHHRSALQIRGHISVLAARWQNEGRSQDLLLPEGKQLDQAQSLLALATFSLSTEEHALIAASSVKARRRRHLRRGVMFAILTLALIAIALGLSAVSAKKQAQERRIEAEGLMGYMLGDFVDKLRPIGKLDLLDSVGDRALEYFAKTGEEGLSQTDLTRRAKALQVLAEVRIARGDPKAGETALLSAQKTLLEQLKEKPEDQEVIQNLAVNISWLGEIEFNRSNWDKADHLFHRYKFYVDRLNELAPEKIEWWVLQATAHNTLGAVALRQKKLTIAEAHFEQEIELRKRAIVRLPHDRGLKNEYANSLSWLGSLKRKNGELSAAERLYEHEGEILRALYHESPNEAEISYSLGLSLVHRATLELALGQKTEALSNFREAEQLFLHILKLEPEKSAWWRDLAKTKIGIESILIQSKTAKSNQAEIDEIGKITEKLTRINPNQPDWSHLVASQHMLVVRYMIKTKKNIEAKQIIERTTTNLQKILRDNPNDLNSKLTLANALIIRAKIENDYKKNPTSRQFCQQGVDLIKGDVATSFDYQILLPWLELHICLNNREQITNTTVKLNRLGFQEAEYIKWLEARE